VARDHGEEAVDVFGPVGVAPFDAGDAHPAHRPGAPALLEQRAVALERTGWPGDGGVGLRVDYDEVVSDLKNGASPRSSVDPVRIVVTCPVAVYRIKASSSIPEAPSEHRTEMISTPGGLALARRPIARD